MKQIKIPKHLENMRQGILYGMMMDRLNVIEMLKEIEKHPSELCWIKKAIEKLVKLDNIGIR